MTPSRSRPSTEPSSPASHNLALAAVLDQDAAELGVTPSQLAIAWVLGQGEKVAPIPGTKRRRYLEENVAAATLDLDPSIVARLSSTIAPGAAAGQRYAFMGTIEE